ncbi:MAG: TraB/GumN family protein [Chitinophagaceae bacterium]|nr:TraB/GumN family protein [Chitinophagaceae bacterium]
MKNNIIKKIFCFLLFVTIIHGYNIQAQEKAGVFYSVTGKGNTDTSWLFGTYHLINDSYLNETPAVLNAFKQSKRLVVEVIIDSSDMATANTKAQLQNKKLTQLLDQGMADSLDAELKATVGQGIEQFQTFKPMAVMLSLSLINLMRDNQSILQKYPGTPMDASFVAKSKLNKQEITALETMNQQMDLLFNAISDEDQAKMLKVFLQNKEQNRKLGNELLRIYFENDISAIYKIYLESIKDSHDMDFLIKQRNDNWMQSLPALFRQQSNFVAVGALHLAGPDGLVEQFRKMGYKVTPQNIR